MIFELMVFRLENTTDCSLLSVHLTAELHRSYMFTFINVLGLKLLAIYNNIYTDACTQMSLVESF